MPSPVTTTLRGFLVHAVEAHEAGELVIYLHGRGEDGRPFAVRDTRFRPCFHVPATDAHRVPTGPAVRVVPSERRALHGGRVARVEGRRIPELRAAREALTAAGVPCYEADLRPVSRYLLERGLRGAVSLHGVAGPAPPPLAVERLFVNPVLSPAELTPPLSLLSIDIETSAEADRVLSIALHGALHDSRPGAPAGEEPDEVLLWWPGPDPPSSARAFATERELLSAFVTAVRRRDPDILTGWNVIDFDLAVLLSRARALGVRLGLGRDGSEPRLPERGGFGVATGAATVLGRVVLDGIALLRGAFVPMDEYGLDHVARRILGEGKTIAAAGRLDELQRLYREEPARFVEYNLHDARLVSRILERLRLVELAMQRSLLTGMPLDRVAASIASFDSLYLPELHRRGVVAPAVAAGAAAGEPQQGGLVLSSVPGLHQGVFVFDFKSLYPSIIRTFQIDPLGYVPPHGDGDGGGGDGDRGDLIVAPGGARFRRQAAILPGILDRLFPRREAANAAGDTVASHAIKILMNSLYGVLGSPACRFYDPELANAITGFGREILLWMKARIEAGGRSVLYGDTDSLFVLAAPDDTPAEPAARALLVELNADLAAHVRARWGVESRLVLEFDTHYARLHLPTVRQGSEGARKRYVGLAVEGGEEKVVFTGMEVVRRDATELARQVQRELYQRLFHDQPVTDYLKGTVERLRRGELDELLVYRKALRRPLASYTASTPPHVAAARKMKAPVGRLVSYLVTTAGPEPASERRHPIDRAHYVDKQVRPIAEPVLELLGLDFDSLMGAPVQLRLL